MKRREGRGYTIRFKDATQTELGETKLITNFNSSCQNYEVRKCKKKHMLEL